MREKIVDDPGRAGLVPFLRTSVRSAASAADCGTPLFFDPLDRRPAMSRSSLGSLDDPASR
jgi:hypothetical protein